MKKDFLHLTDLSAKELHALLDGALRLKRATKAGKSFTPLAGKVMAMIFAKPSLRTRVSFEVAMHQLGGKALYLSPQEVGIGSREPAKDVARVISRYADLIMARLFAHETILDLARYADCPVINGLTDYNHPCQIFSDLLTILEKRGSIDGIHVAWLGDGNNVCNSWLNAASMLDIKLSVATPEGFNPDAATVARAVQAGRVRFTHDPKEAVRGADVIYLDVWASMGQETDRERRLHLFKGFTVDGDMLGLAAKNALLMHCLPAHRGEEVTDDVMECPQSVVFDQAENRLHGQKAIMLDVMGVAIP